MKVSEKTKKGKKIIVGRHINGIFLNPLEWILGRGGWIRKFKNKSEARKYLYSKGATRAEMYYFTFKEVAA